MRGNTVVITGGAQGIGRCCAETLLGLGARVVIADIDREAGEECAAAYASTGDVTFVPTDVSEESSVRALIERTAELHGPIHGLVNNVGIGVTRPIESLELDEWSKVLHTNLTSCFLTTKYALPWLRQSRGAIVNIASTRALQSEAHTEAYSASKGGIVALTHALAVSLSHEVRVNSISPGWIDVGRWKKQADRKENEWSTEDHRQHPAGRVGTPEDIADLVAYLLSEKAGFITGQNFVVDGGMTKKMIYVE